MSTEHESEDRQQLLDKYMTERGLKTTRQRTLIMETFFQTGGHQSVDEVWARVRKTDARVSLATVYRTMKLLSESGVVQEHKFGDGFTRYELSDEEAHHDHLVCLECGKIIEFEEPQIEVLQDRVAKRYGFLVRAHKHEMYGLCSDCQKPKAARSGRADPRTTKG